MRINSKDCERGNCWLYPCKREKYNNKLAFNERKKWFIAEPKIALHLDDLMNKRINNATRLANKR